MFVRLLLFTGIVWGFSHASAAHADNLLELTVGALKRKGTEEFRSFCDERMGKISLRTKGQREVYICRLDKGAVVAEFEGGESIRARATVPEEVDSDLYYFMKYAFGDDAELANGAGDGDGRVTFLWNNPDLKARLTEVENPPKTTVELSLKSSPNGRNRATVDVPTSTKYPSHWGGWTPVKVAAAFFDMRTPAGFQRWCEGVGGRRAVMHPIRLAPFNVEGETTLTCDNVDQISFKTGKHRWGPRWHFAFGVRFDKDDNLTAAFGFEEEIASPYNHFPQDNALTELVWRYGEPSQETPGMYQWSPAEGILVRLANRGGMGSMVTIDAPGRSLENVQKALRLTNQSLIERPNPPQWEDLPPYCKRYKRVQDCPKFYRDEHGDCRYQEGNVLNAISPSNGYETRSLAGEGAWCSRPCVQEYSSLRPAMVQSYCCSRQDEPPSSKCPTFH